MSSWPVSSTCAANTSVVARSGARSGGWVRRAARARVRAGTRWARRHRMWARMISAVIGIWLMTAPAVLDYGGAARTTDRIVGPLVASIAVIAVWEVLRPARWAVLPLAAALVIAPWMLGYDAPLA